MTNLRIFFLTIFLTLAFSAVAFAERPEVSADRKSFDVATMRRSEEHTSELQSR